MTAPHTSPDDAFDRWLDDLVDGSTAAASDPTAASARELHRRMGLPPAPAPRLDAQRRAAIRERVLSQPVSRQVPPAATRHRGSTGIVAAVPPVGPVRPWARAGHIAGIATAALLVLIALASVGMVLRLNDGDGLRGVAETAPAGPFASPTAFSSCATDDTLLLMPEGQPDAATLAALPFPVAWFRDGTLTVERAGEVIREIDIGPADHLSPTPWPDVAFAWAAHSGAEETFTRATLVDLASGDMFDMGPVHAPQWTGGPFVLWASDEERRDWHLLDLRTFERISLTDRFNLTPAQSWAPGMEIGARSADATVLLLTVNPLQYSEPTTPQPTPDTALPTALLSQSALLIDGSLDAVSVVGPIQTRSGATAVSPDGSVMAWLAPSDRASERILTVADVASGEVTHSRTVEATYANSLLFSADGSTLYNTIGDELQAISIEPTAATPSAERRSPITLPASSYLIRAATPDRTRLLLSHLGSSPEDSSVWVDLVTGQTHQYRGISSHKWWAGSTTGFDPASTRYMLIDDLTTSIRILDMETGDAVATVQRIDGEAAMVTFADGAAYTHPWPGVIEYFDFRTGGTTSIVVPDPTAGLPREMTISANGRCTAMTWPLDGDQEASYLLGTGRSDPALFLDGAIGGWVPTGRDGG